MSIVIVAAPATGVERDHGVIHAAEIEFAAVDQPRVGVTLDRAMDVVEDASTAFVGRDGGDSPTAVDPSIQAVFKAFVQGGCNRKRRVFAYGDVVDGPAVIGHTPVRA